jgi:zinc protease
MPKLLRAGAFVGVLLLVATCTPTDPKYAIQYTEKRGVIEANGLRFVIMPDPSTQLVEVDVRYGAGASEDPPGKAGLAHMVEHTMFQLRPDGDNSPPLFQYVQQLSTFMNAYTEWDKTHYMTTARADQLESILKIEAMRLFYGCKPVPENEFIREREVVRNEIRGHGGADAEVLPLLLQDVYPKGHAYSHTPGGDDRQIASFTLKDACDFIDKYYVPANATVYVVGGVDYDATVKLIEKWFGKLPKKPVGQLATIDEVQPHPETLEHKIDIERPIIAVSWPFPPSYTEEGRNVRYAIGTVFRDLLDKASDYDFADNVSQEVLGSAYAPVFSIIIELKSMDKEGEALDFVKKAAAKAHRGFADVEWQQFDNIRKRAKADFIANFESISGFEGRANQLADFVQFDKSLDFDAKGDVYMIHELDKYDHFDGDAIGKTIKKYLDYDRATVSVFRPSQEGIKGDVRSKVTYTMRTDAEPEQVEVDPKEALHPLKMTSELGGLDGAVRYQLSNGMNVVLLPVQGSLPIVSAELSFDVGAAQSSKPGEAEAAAGFLNPPMDAEAMFATGTRVFGNADNDHTSFFSRNINIYLEVVIRSLERLVRVGEYDQDQIESWQKSLRESFKTKEAQTQAEFQRQLYGALYGADHPYVKNTVILPENAGSIDRDELTQFAKDHYVASNATLVIAGNFDVEAAKRYVSSAFGGWAKGSADVAVAAQDLNQRTGPAYIGVVGRDNPDIDIRIAYPSAPGIDGEQAARMVLDGMLNERLWDLRAKNALTYGLYAYRETNAGPSAYLLGGQVDGERGGEAITAMRAGIDELRKPGDQWNVDFVRARRKQIQRLLGVSTVSSELASRLSTIAWFGLKPDYYSTLLKLVAAVSPAEVKGLIARELDPQKEIIVVEGDQAHLDQAFKDAGLSDVKIVVPQYK